TSALTRPSKLRLPESTAAATRSLSLMALEISGASGPELPMQVVQPKPTRLNPSLSRSFCSPDLSRYSATTCEPGASDVFTHGLTVSPFCAALRASRPAPIITLGFDVLVHEVMAAMTTSPWPRSWLRPATGTRLSASAALLNSLSMAAAKPFLTSFTGARACGGLGAASEGSLDPSSSLSTSVNTGSAVNLVRYIPCALA